MNFKSVKMLKCSELILVHGLKVLLDIDRQPDSLERQLLPAAISKLNYRISKAKGPREGDAKPVLKVVQVLS